MGRPDLARLIAERVVIFDGAMGTELYQRHQFVNVCYEHLCVTQPALVMEIHTANRNAGADVLTTNSFAANRYKLAAHLLADQVREICRASAAIAREVARDDVLVAGSVGPLGQPIGAGGIDEDDAEAAFAMAIEGLALGGADLIIFETFARRADVLPGLRAAARLGMPYIVSAAVNPLGLTRSGESVESFFAPFPADLPPPVMIGFNCGVGPSEMLAGLEAFIPKAPYPVLVQPNAGAPQMVNDRMIYMTSPEYLATYAQHFVQLGARGVGGCCGTGPAHIRELAAGVKTIHGHHVQIVETLREGVRLVDPKPAAECSRFGSRLVAGKWVATVEIVPPLGWDLEKTLEKSAVCRDAGVDAINIPDGPRASCRISPMITAMHIQQQVGIEVLLHVTCRDRNVIGVQSDLLGCAAGGLRNLLIITGDPPKVGDYPFATPVFDIDSIGLLRIASRLNRGVDVGGQPVVPPTPFLLGCGADPSHLDQEREVSRFAQKVENGAHYAITQPVFDPDVLLRFIDRVRAMGITIPIIAGIWPLASLRNAEFLNNEVPGVHVPDAILRRMAGATTKESARDEGIAIAREIREIVRPHVAGIQVSAPFGNVQTSLRVIEP